MKSGKYRFYLVFILIFTLVSLVAWFLAKTYPIAIHPKFWTIQLFFLIVSLLAHFLTEKGLRKVTEFHIYYMGSMVIRLLFSMFFLLIMLYAFKEKRVVFVLNFLALYLIYTSFENYYLFRNLRADLKNQE